MNELEALAADQLNNPHYLKSVTQLGDSRPIVANRDIYSSSGMKLIGSGTRVDSSLYNRLLQHKLFPALDEGLSTEETVTSVNLVESARQLLTEDRQLKLIQSAQLDGQTLLDVLKKVPLNPAIAFRLTVMRETNVALFQHSLYVTLVSVYLGMQLHMDKSQLIDLATAGILHDIGMLYVDPKFLAQGYRMTEPERHHLYVHPMTSAMILSNYPEYKRRVLDAILQHHERLDGSGYPHGLRKLSPLGEILAIAVIVTSRYDQGGVGYGTSKLETMLKLNLHQFGSNLVQHLKILYQPDEDDSALVCSIEDKNQAEENMHKVSSIFLAWGKIEANPKDPLYVFASERLTNLKIAILDAGLDLEGGNLNLMDFEDPRACMDVKLLLEETLWQLHKILREIKRRRTTLDTDSPMLSTSTLNAWLAEAEILL